MKRRKVTVLGGPRDGEVWTVTANLFSSGIVVVVGSPPPVFVDNSDYPPTMPGLDTRVLWPRWNGHRYVLDWPRDV